MYSHDAGTGRSVSTATTARRLLTDGGEAADTESDVDSASGTAADEDAADEDTAAGTATSDAASDSESGEYAVLLDVLPQGRPGDDRPPSQKSPVAYALGEPQFQLYELTLSSAEELSVGDRIRIGPEAADVIDRFREVDLGDLTHNADAELEYAVEAIVDANERRFVDFYNEAGPISLRLHQLNLLPGIGEKLRNDILDERKRGPFESFADVEERISGLHNPREVIVDRIVEELREEDLKYQRFVGYEG